MLIYFGTEGVPERVIAHGILCCVLSLDLEHFLQTTKNGRLLEVWTSVHIVYRTIK